MVQNNELVVIGDAFIDIIVPINGIEGGDVFQRDIILNIGGLASTAINASRNGVNAAFIGKVGDDLFGKVYLEKLVAEDVTPFLCKSQSQNTGICVSLIHENKDRTMIIKRGANDHLRKEEVPLEVIKEANYVHFSGYSFADEGLRKVIIDVMKESKKFDTKVVFNGGSYNIIKENLIIIRGAIKKYIDVLILNINESKSITEEHELQKITKRLKKLVNTFIITMGERGSLAYDGYNEIRTDISSIENVVDTTGAGDAFSGGVLAGMIRNKPFKESILLGHKIAGEAIQIMGAF